MVERRLQASVVRWLNAQPNTMARVNGPGPAHVVGDPDVYGCVLGQMFQLELKTEAGRVTPKQEHEMALWAEAGASVHVFRSLDEVKAWFSRFAAICVAVGP